MTTPTVPPVVYDLVTGYVIQCLVDQVMEGLRILRPE